MGLKVEAQLSCVTSWSHEVRAAECGQEVVKRHLVRHINGSELKTPPVLVATKNVVISHRDVEEMTRGDARWIVIVILSPRRWYFHPGRTVL